MALQKYTFVGMHRETRHFMAPPVVLKRKQKNNKVKTGDPRRFTKAKAQEQMALITIAVRDLRGSISATHTHTHTHTCKQTKPKIQH